MKRSQSFLSIILLSKLLFASSVFAQTESQLATPPVTPVWAFRHIVWEDSINTDKGVRQLVGGYLDRNIPVGATIIDSPWSVAYNDFNWDANRYPQPKELIDEMGSKGVKVILWLTGAVNYKGLDTRDQKCEQYDYAVEHNYGINNSQPGHWWKGDGIHVDFTNPEAAQWWGTQLDKVFGDNVYGWKVDQGEMWFGPFVETSKGKMSNEQFRPYYYDAMYDYTVSRKPDGIIIARPYSHQGGFAASVGKMNMGWCGDFGGDWNGLKQQIRNIYISSRRGYGAVGTEVAGFYQKRAQKKQFVRYMQFGTMTATMINGGENGAFSNHLPWWHGDDVEEIYRDCVVLHHNLIPYMFSTVVDCNLNGGSLLKDCNDTQESHRLGNDIFTKAITSDDDTVEFTLPSEGEWIDYWTGELYPAGTKIKQTYPLDKFPLFIRSGAIIPVYSDPNPGSEIQLWVYPNGKSSKLIHMPTGEGVDYTDVLFEYDKATNTLTVDGKPNTEYKVVVK